MQLYFRISPSTCIILLVLNLLERQELIGRLYGNIRWRKSIIQIIWQICTLDVILRVSNRRNILTFTPKGSCRDTASEKIPTIGDVYQTIQEFAKASKVTWSTLPLFHPFIITELSCRLNLTTVPHKVKLNKLHQGSISVVLANFADSEFANQDGHLKFQVMDNRTAVYSTWHTHIQYR